MKLFTILSFLLLVFLSHRVNADSPLTSTHFSKAYLDVPIVKAAKSSDGKITEEMMAFILDQGNKVDEKLALINALGWRYKGKNNYDLFVAYAIRTKYKSESKLKKKASGELLICMAYLKALDNYFTVTDAIVLANKAKEKSKSYSVWLIAGMIEAQQAMESNWCKVFQITNDVRQNKSLIMDMRETASEVIFEYMGLYEESCND